MEKLRLLSQLFTLVSSNLYLGFIKTKQVYQGSLKSVCVPFLNCHSCPSAFFSCPIGSIQHFLTLRQFPFTVMGFLTALGMTAGAMPCGWLCPVGLTQDLLYRIRSFKISIARQLSSFRYVVLLLLVVLLPLVTQETWFSKLCPAGTMQAALPWVIWNPEIPTYREPVVTPGSIGWFFALKLFILAFFIGLAVIAKRPFCRLACPLGAILGFFNRYSLLRLKVDASQCKGCTDCRSKCPVELDVQLDANASTCVRCLNCLDCEHVCIEGARWARFGSGKPEEA
ncbi:MAG: 4Fe-4S binding protein [Planctomycetes bacterium]|nr:4Fe-4S binding protein [Planctomycetota bacterium]